MQTFEKWFDQDLNAPIITRYCESLTFSADNLSNVIGVNLYKDTQPVTVSGTVACTVIRQDGGTVTIAGTSSGNSVSATLTAACFAIPGPIAVMLQIIDGDTKVTVLRMTCNAVLSATDQPIDPGTIIPSVTDLINDIETAVASIPADYSDLLASIAPTFSASAAYAAGTYVWYDGDLYRFTEAHAAGSWTGTDATAAVLCPEMASLSDAFGQITEVHVSKNLYDKDTCGPADGYMYNKNGVYTAMDVYACSGKMPVEASTQYAFSAGTATMIAVRYFSGESGATFISGETLSGSTFTTPSGCTFAAINLFGVSHTTAQYEAAIAVAQLEKGSAPTPYEPYGDTYYIPLDAVEDGDKLAGVSDVTAAQSQINLYDKTLAVNGKYVSNGSGGAEQSSADYAYTGLIPVKPSTQYNISKAVDAPLDITTVVYEYGSTGTYLRAVTITDGYGYLLSFRTSADCYFVAANLYKVGHTAQEFSDTIDTLMLCYGTNRPQSYAAYDAETVVKAGSLSDAFFHPDCFAGKKWLATGTSLTWYDGKAYQAGVHTGAICRGYVGNVARRLPLLVINEGINGATLGNISANSLINRYTSLPWASVDIATIEFGVNDLGNNVPVGTASDAAGTSTFAACLRTVIEYALAQNPKLCLVICTDPDVRGANTNNNGNTLKDYADVTLAIADQYRLPVCDWYYHSGINALNKGDTTKDWMTCDGTHPSDEGHIRMGALLLKVFEGLRC